MQKRSAETRRRILEAALKLFAKEGYESSGVAEICQAAGVSKGAFYHHFPTKQAIFLELLHTWLGSLDVELQAVQQSTQTVPQALLEMTKLMRLVFQQAGDYLPMFLEFWAHASRNPEIWEAVIAPYHRYQTFFEDMIRQGVAEGSLREVEPDQAARAIVAVAVGLLLQGVLDPQETNWGQASYQSMQILVKGLLNKET